MKIDDAMNKAAQTQAADVRQRQALAARADTPAKSPESSKAAASGEAGSAVNVSLSSQLKAVKEQMGDSTSFDAKKVERIKTAIANGEFSIDTAKVADGLLRTVSELFQKPGK
ncbi:MAG: flagellar biosynthesis anti-sigma factor FlgM [Alistipes senegalensis]|nr:flagellar biosynthesis anti-sigma factor FlgM [Oxalobacter formigenes]MCM1281954.1 flagellar biosynthesis anti-sigma factor FlgM [Alistipes senegalensis]